MEQPRHVLESGTRVRTRAVLGATDGMLVAEGHLTARRAEAEGTIQGVAGGHGGDVYWVRHGDNGLVAAYAWTEFEIIQNPPMRIEGRATVGRVKE